MKKLLLLVDDDKEPMRYYVMALEQEGFKVAQCFKPAIALDYAEKRSSEIAAVILDVMMPPGVKYTASETNHGLKTGVFLIKDLRKKLADVPVIILTNVTNSETLKEFDQGTLVKVIQKMDCPPFSLVELVSEMLSAVDKKNIDNENGESRERTKRGENAYES